MSLKKIITEVKGIEHSLPYFVARDEGFFFEEGIEIDLIKSKSKLLNKETKDFESNPSLISPFHSGGGQAFEDGNASLYRACEWGQIKRSHDSTIDTRVNFKRSNMSTQAIVVRADSPYNIPQDLADVRIGVNMHHGSHYVAIQSLEGFLEPHEINIVNAGSPEKRFRDLMDGRIDAIAIMEPWVTVAEKLNYKIIVEAHYAGLEVISSSIDYTTVTSINRAISKAAKKLNDNPYPYLHYMIAEVPLDIITLKAEDFNRNRLRFVYPSPYSQKDFERSYRWMVKWGLIDKDSTFSDLVDTRFDSTIYSAVEK